MASFVPLVSGTKAAAPMSHMGQLSPFGRLTVASAAEGKAAETTL
jgi:hypothetical protein